MPVLICGGGIVGASIAYFLSRRGVGSIVIERCSPACGASGKGGGFLAADWSDGTPLEPLAKRSFALHAELARRLGNSWGHRGMQAYGGAGGAPDRHRPASPRLGWLSDRVQLTGRLGAPAGTAQIHPGRFTEALLGAAQAGGAELRRGTVGGLLFEGSRAIGVEVDGVPLHGDAVVIAMGPWSQLARRWLPLPPVYGLKGHSLVYETGDALPPEALFLEYGGDGGNICSPEIFPRADGTTYICAISSETPLPVDPADVGGDPGALERLERIAAEISPVLAGSRIVARQACYRPITRDGLPLIGRVPGIGGAYVATGHSVWGILNAPATGEALAELIVDGAATTVPPAAFDPARFAG